MKLSFGTIFNNQPNYFLEKIWIGLRAGGTDLEDTYFNYQRRHLEKFGRCWDGDTFGEFMEAKIHTLRRDIGNHWKAGENIQLVTGLNTPDEFQFAPVLKCQSVQRIEIDYSGLISSRVPAVFMDYELADEATVARLAVNDGFATVEDFFLYFNEDFIGNLVHWTPCRYG